MPKDERTYGFSRPDAEALVNMIGVEEGNVPRRKPRGGGGNRLFRFTMNENWGATTAGAADSDILEMDGTDTGIDADVLDPLGTFSTLTSGSAGLCIRQDGKYYAIQAPCP